MSLSPNPSPFWITWEHWSRRVCRSPGRLWWNLNYPRGCYLLHNRRISPYYRKSAGKISPLGPIQAVTSQLGRAQDWNSLITVWDNDKAWPLLPPPPACIPSPSCFYRPSWLPSPGRSQWAVMLGIGKGSSCVLHPTVDALVQLPSLLEMLCIGSTW